ncbi:hypothetical protein KXV86_009061, partial [Aspergillus fumigatus]
MDSEIPLPPPRRIRHRSPASSSSSTANPPTASSFRKTYRLSRFDDRSSQPSSDPALFSSDDIPASGLENYNAPVSSGDAVGRKRRYRGTWWGETVVDPKRKRADFKDKRLVDSGVWMGSDESTAESLLPSEDASIWGEDLMRNMQTSTSAGACSERQMGAASSQPANSQLRPTVSQPRGPRKVEERLEVRKFLFDNGNLRALPSGLLRPLQYLTKLPSVREPPISEEGYSSLKPFLRLFLAGNALTAVSGEIFELDSLRVLSLRNNKLTEIPPAIRKLTMLQEINLAVNRLR